MIAHKLRARPLLDLDSSLELVVVVVVIFAVVDALILSVD